MKVLTLQEAADYLKISRCTMLKLLKNKEISGVRLNGRGDWRLTQESIDRYLNAKNFCQQTSSLC